MSSPAPRGPWHLWKTIVGILLDDIERLKRRMLRLHPFGTFFAAVAIAILEITLAIVALPVYILADHHNDPHLIGDDKHRLKRYTVRRILTLGALCALVGVTLGYLSSYQPTLAGGDPPPPTPTNPGGILADLVLGQADYTSSGANRGGAVAANTISDPFGMAVDSAKIYVADMSNNRVLIWNTTAPANGANADIVLGQANFTSASANRGGTVASGTLDSPFSVSSDGSKIYVADFTNNRILIWNSTSPASGANADIILGQTSATVNTAGTTQSTLTNPRGVYSDGSKIYVADSGNNRVLIWNTTSPVNGANADIVLGQANFTSAVAATTQSGMNLPYDVYSDGSKIYVADNTNNRVLIWNTTAPANGANADVVLGQSDFITGTAGNPANMLYSPLRVVSDGRNIYVADSSNYRVLVYRTVSPASGRSADVLFGRSLFTDQTAYLVDQKTLAAPAGMAVGGGKLYVGDTNDDRLVRFDLTAAAPTISIDTATPIGLGVGTVSIGVNWTTGANYNFSEYAVYEAYTGKYVAADTTLTSNTAVYLASSTWIGGGPILVGVLTPGGPYTFSVAGRYVVGDDSATSTAATTYTLPAAPLPPTAATTTDPTILAVTLNGGTNSTATTFSLYNITSGNFIGANGASAASPVYQSTSTWGAKNVTGLSANASYTFSSVAKNVSGSLSATSTTSTIRFTQPSGGTLVSDDNFRVSAGGATTAVISGTPGSGTGSFRDLVIPDTVGNMDRVTVDFSRVILNNMVTTSLPINLSRASADAFSNFQAFIPAGVTMRVTSGTWDGTLIAPTAKALSTVGRPSFGSVRSVMEVGYPGITILLSEPSRLVFQGQAGLTPAYQTPSGETVRITTPCNSPNDGSNISGNGECYANSGNDLVVWTKHYTDFFIVDPSGGAPAPAPPTIVRAGPGFTPQSLVVNNGAAETTNREVDITLNIVGASSVALSNADNFAGASFAAFKEKMKWLLTPGNGEKKVYARFRTDKGGTADATAVIRLVGQPTDAVATTTLSVTTTLPAATTTPQKEAVKKETAKILQDAVKDAAKKPCSLTPGQPYKTDRSSAVYYITDECVKQLFHDSSVYFSYYPEWSRTQVVSKKDLSAVPNSAQKIIAWGPLLGLKDGDLVKVLSDPKVYLINGSTRRWIPNEATFNALGYVWNRIKDIAVELLNQYTEGDPLPVAGAATTTATQSTTTSR